MRRTWELLRNLTRDSNLSWCTIGDMNNIVEQSDKKGGALYPQWLLDGFNDTLEDAGLKDMELYGHPFTWERGGDTDSWLEIRTQSYGYEEKAFSFRKCVANRTFVQHYSSSQLGI
ncbi:hypothetical protein POM88_017142 [Heracleum sosnowskyi]|uniref:Uncharacterized protein n=1 Tax=Heracleum sosnowskyi TaxID=360622 RepID=A0AAD8IPY1_9APIA|nr:hypothetical protein POM88_017142 [Heracleum sosnowskyi]